MGKLQRIYTIENYASSSFVIPSKIRQRLYGIQSNLNVCVLNEDIMAILEAVDVAAVAKSELHDSVLCYYIFGKRYTLKTLCLSNLEK
ncbi:15284_t:CDS:2 [Entrophospora sp. SA101]|nr:15284_t:CDS:2 [Entrophospora sp. SA101]